MLLVKAGARVYATDYHGMSVSDVANTSDSVDRRKNLGIHRRDLCDEVLTECGYDPAAVQGQFQELEKVYTIKEEVSDSDERESMIEEQDSEMDGQDFKDTENNCGIIMEDDNIQYPSSNPVGDGLQLPGVMEETLDADIWSQKDSSMPKDSAYGGGLLPSVVTDNQDNFLQQDPVSAFNNTEQSHLSYLQDPTSVSIPSICQENFFFFGYGG